MIPMIILTIENDGDRDLMISMYKELHTLMKVTAYAVVKNDIIAEDMVQDALVKLIEKIDTIRELDPQKRISYAVSTVKNLSINHYNKHIGKKRHSFYGLMDDVSDTIADLAYTPDTAFYKKEEYRALGEAIEKLDEKDRDILYLKYNLEISDKEIGEIMGVSKNSVRTYLTRARRKAKILLAQDDEVTR